MSEFMFCATKMKKEPSNAAYKRAAKRIQAMDGAVSLTGAGYPAITHCKYQVWCCVQDWGNAATVYRGEEAAKFQSIIDEELSRFI